MIVSRHKDGGTLVTQPDLLDAGKVNELVYPCTPAEILGWLSEDKKSRPLIQDRFPHFSAEQREFLLTGCTNAAWRRVFARCK